MTSWFPSNLEVFVVVGVYDKCKVYFLAQQRILCRTLELTKYFFTYSILKIVYLKDGEGGRVPVKSRLEC